MSDEGQKHSAVDKNRTADATSWSSVVAVLNCCGFVVSRAFESVARFTSKGVAQRRRGARVTVFFAAVLITGATAANHPFEMAVAASSPVTNGDSKNSTSQPATQKDGSKPDTTQTGMACAASAASPAASGQKPVITELSDSHCNTKHLRLGLDDDLGVGLNQSGAVDASTFALFLNGREVISAGNATYDG